MGSENFFTLFLGETLTYICKYPLIPILFITWLCIKGGQISKLKSEKKDLEIANTTLKVAANKFEAIQTTIGIFKK